MILTLTLLAWYASGVYSFIYWWTTEHDFTMDEILFCMIVGLIGPFAFFSGWRIHGKKEPSQPRLLVKRKRTKPYQ